MATKYPCSECGDEFAPRGFGSHNQSVHNGEAELVRDPGPEEGGSGGGTPGGEAVGEGEAGPGDPDAADEGEPGGSEVDADDLVSRGREAYREAYADDGSEVEGDPDAGRVEDDLADDEDEGFNCGNCGHELEYLGGVDADGGGKECPECGERLLWSRVEGPA